MTDKSKPQQELKQSPLPFPPLERGERNHNPGNLRFSPRIRWQGLANPPYDSKGFCRFLDDEHGIRACARDVHTKWARGLKTIAAIIEAYAPPSENDTKAYIDDICDHFGIEHSNANVTPVDLSEPFNLQVFVAAVIRHEEGRCIYPTVLLTKCCYEALGLQPPA